MCGRLILDTTCFGSLSDGNRLAAMRASLVVAHLTTWPSAMNALEIRNTQNLEVRDRLKRVLFDLLGDRFLLPWPHDLLREATDFAAGKVPDLWITRHGYEELFLQPDATASIWPVMQQVLLTTDELFHERVVTHRAATQRLLKARRLRDPWESLPDFLDSQWAARDLREHVLSITWERLGMPGAAPIDSLLHDEMWCLFLDIQGAAFFEETVLHEQPPRAHQTDMLQLLYLAYAPVRVIASTDKAMLRQANGILRRRYRNARAVHLTEVIATA